MSLIRSSSHDSLSGASSQGPRGSTGARRRGSPSEDVRGSSSGIRSECSYDSLRDFIEQHRRLFVLTGAGCSTDSGIPDYRAEDGTWKRPQPVSFQAFMGDPLVRHRYWARSLIGWARFSRARPNDAHRALAVLQYSGRAPLLVTQNVDRLHQAAGARSVIDLHGRLDLVRCMTCDGLMRREGLQEALRQRNPGWVESAAAEAPDGDSDLDGVDFSTFDVPDCEACGGVLKPDVVFFGECVPRDRVHAAMQALDVADALLVVGSSLMVYSGYRFAEAAARAGKPIASIALGRTRADHLATLRVREPCAAALAFLLEQPSPVRLRGAAVD